MKNIISLSEEQRRAYLIWVFAPATAHLFCGSSIVTLLLFPILITVSQYFLFRQDSSSSRPLLWFIMLPVTFAVWIQEGPAMNEHKPDGIFYGVTAYYIGQISGSFIIPFMTRGQRIDRVIGWIVANMTAMTIWLALYSLVKDSITHNFDYSYFITYPSISIIAHALSGFLLFIKYAIK